MLMNYLHQVKKLNKLKYDKKDNSDDETSEEKLEKEVIIPDINLDPKMVDNPSIESIECKKQFVDVDKEDPIDQCIQECKTLEEK